MAVSGVLYVAVLYYTVRFDERGSSLRGRYVYTTIYGARPTVSAGLQILRTTIVCLVQVVPVRFDSVD